MKNKAPIRYMGAVLLIFLFAQAAPVVAQSDAIQALNETAASTSLAAKIDTTYVEDYNGDRLIDMQDVLWLIRNGMKAHADSVCDYNRDGRFSLMDVMVLLVNIRQGRLTPVIHGGVYLIKGRVMDGAVGLSDVSVSVRGTGFDTTFMTNNAGAFRLTGVENGAYRVLLYKRNYRFTPDSLNVTVNGDSLIIPNIPAVYSGYGVVGRVFDQDSVGLAMVGIRVVGAGRDTTVYTDGEGRYRVVSSFSAGVYVLRPSREYYTFTPDSLVLNMGSVLTIDAPLIKAKFNNPAQITLHKITGRVSCTSGGLGNIQVFLIDDKGQQTKTLTDGFGSFYFLVPDGHYVVVPMAFIGYAYNPLSYDLMITGYDVTNISFFQYGVEVPAQ